RMQQPKIEFQIEMLHCNVSGDTHIVPMQRGMVPMSKQLARSIVCSVLAMSAYVLLGHDASNTWGGAANGYALAVNAKGGTMPAFGQFLPALR
ncbi:MAG: hypothetical protein ACKOW1_01960, partial [Novosphingobium sp.]